MIDNITIRVRDMDAIVKFYTATLAPIGYLPIFDKYFDSVRVVGFGKKGAIDTWFTTDIPVSGPLHIAWKANSIDEVNLFYENAIQSGGKDNGKPGIRPEYHENYYAAFILDPEGNNTEVVYRG